MTEPKPIPTLSSEAERLSRAGYTERFRAEDGGLRAIDADRLFAPKELAVDEVVRFEGTSDVDSEAILIALRDRTGELKGTWTPPYGPEIPAEDAKVLRGLELLGGEGASRV